MSDIELSKPYARMPHCVPAPESPHCANAVVMTSVDVYTAEQVRQLLAAERERALDAVAALAAQSRDREERDIIGKCWDAIRRGSV